jgi:large subunit ribosomal protein L5
MAKEKDKSEAEKAGRAAAAKAAAAAKRAAAAKKDDTDGGDEVPAGPAPEPRLALHYKSKVVPELMQKFGYTNVFQVPRLQKIVISMGLGKAMTSGDKGNMDTAEKELSVIAGQKPVRCKAKKSVANFKVREGMETGLKVTLRGKRMYEFLDRLISLAFPRVKDFRGVSPNGFDKAGNYNFGLTEQTVFAEVDAAAVTSPQGMNITVVTTAESPDHGRELLKQFGFPFRENDKNF